MRTSSEEPGQFCIALVLAAGQVVRGAESADYYECEYSIPLANLSLTAGSKCKIGILGYTHDTSDADKEFRNALFEVQL